MVDDRASPSAGWREVCDEMDVETGIEESTRRCPTCNRSCENLLADAYECEEHGVFRASASDEGSVTEAEESGADDFDEAERHARSRAD